MRERIDIIVPEDELARDDEKAERLRKAFNFEPAERVPAIAEINQWVALDGRGSRFAEFIQGPRDNLRGQIFNYKWRVENIRDDAPIATEPLTIQPDFGCLRGVEFPMEIVWLEDGPPKCHHPLTEPEQIGNLEVPDPGGGLNAKKIEWYRAMSDIVDDFDVRINGEPLQVQVTLTHPGGPIPTAFALAGSNLLLWMLTDPGRVHRLLDIVTRSHIQCIALFDEVTGREPDHPVDWMGADTAEMISPGAFREFVVPYYLRVWEAYEGPRPGPRRFHMCGRIDHLLDIVRDDLGVTFLDGFGFSVDRSLLAEKVAGRVLLKGGPSPMLIKDGPREAIVGECLDYMERVGSKGGYILSCGGDAAVGTPPAHFEAMVEASRRDGGTHAQS